MKKSIMILFLLILTISCKNIKKETKYENSNNELETKVDQPDEIIKSEAPVENTSKIEQKKNVVQQPESIEIEENNYKYVRAYYYDGGYSSDNTLKENHHLIANLDFRYANILLNNGEFEQLDILYNYFIQLENKLGFLDSFKLFSYVIDERKKLRNNKFTWTFDSIDDALNEIKSQVESQKISNKIFPPSVIRGGLYYIHSETMSNYDASIYLNEDIKFSNMVLKEFITANNGYVITLYNNKKQRPEYFFYLKKINSNIYNELNGKYEITAFFYPGGEADAEWYATWAGSTLEKDLIYGSIEQIGELKEGDSCFVVSETLNIYNESNDKSSVLIQLKENDKFSIAEIGEFEVYNNIGANWIKVYVNGEEGWCFGSILNISRVYVDTTGQVM